MTSTRDLATRIIASDTLLAGSIRRMHVFLEMAAGKAFPLSADQYLFP